MSIVDGINTFISNISHKMDTLDGENAQINNAAASNSLNGANNISLLRMQGPAASESALISNAPLASAYSKKNIADFEEKRNDIACKKTEQEMELEKFVDSARCTMIGQTETPEGNSVELPADFQYLKYKADSSYQNYLAAIDRVKSSNPQIADNIDKFLQFESEYKNGLDQINSEKLYFEWQYLGKKNEIDEQNAAIKNFQSEIGTINTQIAGIDMGIKSISAPFSANKLNEQKKQLEFLKDFKYSQLAPAQNKMTRLKDDHDLLEANVFDNSNGNTNNMYYGLIQDTKEQQKIAAENAIEYYQNEIVSLIPDMFEANNIKNLQQIYMDSAKDFEEKSFNYLYDTNAQNIVPLQQQLISVNDELTQARNQQIEDGNYEINQNDVIALATQYEGLTNDDMKKIFSDETNEIYQDAQFHEGLWCADFVSNIIKKVYGKDNTPGDFANTCKNLASCSSIKEWGKNRVTNDPKEVKAGDLVVFNTNKGKKHIAIVTSINEDGSIINTIDGNTLNDYGQYYADQENSSNPGCVNRRTRTFEEVDAFVRMR